MFTFEHQGVSNGTGSFAVQGPVSRVRSDDETQAGSNISSDVVSTPSGTMYENGPCWEASEFSFNGSLFDPFSGTTDEDFHSKGYTETGVSLAA